MKHQTRKKGRECTQADHRPMLPELRKPADPLDAAIREGRRIDCLLEPKEYLNWR